MTRYELLERIGVGGMAEIFRGKAVAAGGFEKPVAIKRILPHLSQDRRFVELLIAEAKVLSLLKHRNIVQIFDVGLGDDGQYFLVMEYVDGKDIGAVQRALEQKRRRMPFDLALHIGAEICEALEHAHVSRGPDGKPMALVHRDVSPSNVLLSRSGEVKLTDFGIAKRAESDATQGGAVRGKFAYISPEQARNETLDPRSDVFSVGILMWELCCNRRLFSGLDDLAALRAVRDPAIPRPSEIDPRLPPELDQLLLSALAKDKKQRFASCGVLGQKLRSLRYSLDETSGDPATELAKIIDSTEALERESKQMIAVPSSGRHDFDGGEATVIRIHTADAFSARDEGKSISQARQVIDRFEEEETRLASLSGDQLRMLRKGATRDSVEMTAEKPRMERAQGRAPRRPVDDDEEMTRAREPLDLGRSGFERSLETPSDERYVDSLDTPPHQRFTPTDDTRLLAPRDRRTPLPQQAVRPQRAPTVPPPTPQRRAASPTTETRDRARGEPDTRSRTDSRQPGRPHIATPQPMPAQAPMQLDQPMLPMGGPMQPAPTPQPQVPTPQPGMLPMGAPMAHVPTPQPGQPMPPHLAQPPFVPSQPAGAYPGWGPPIAAQLPPREATPTVPESYDGRPVYNRGQGPQVAGFNNASKSRPGLKPWVLVVGALVMAALAFAITRAFIG